MSCLHAEDVCQHCLKKVQTTTEDAPPPPTEKTITEGSGLTTKEKAFYIFLDSSLLVSTIAACYWSSKNALKLIFDVFDNIIDTIEKPTKKITKRTD